jgi:cell division protein FtsB
MFMGFGSAGTPPWVDEEKIDKEKAAAKIEALEKENEALKKRIKQLEGELKKLKK